MPLAQDLIGQKAGTNPGLALTKLAPPVTGREWSDHLDRIAGRTALSGYDKAFKRMRARTHAGPPYRSVLCATSLAPVLCGMGERTPGENGLTLHPVYGVPFLPGTSLKGILRAWVLSQDWGEDWREGGGYFRDLFGVGGHDGVAGVLDILDALPVPTSTMFTVDVLTPHYERYYQSIRADAPLGWEGPNPVRFLAAAKGLDFRIVIEGDPAWVPKATEWLALALSERGLGAKSRAGYGRFACKTLTADAREEREAAEHNVAIRRTKAEQVLAALREYTEDQLRPEIEGWLLGDPVKGGVMRDVLSAATDATTREHLAIVRTIGDRFGLRAVWAKRLTNKRADEGKKAKARRLIDAWDELFSMGGRT